MRWLMLVLWSFLLVGCAARKGGGAYASTDMVYEEESVASFAGRGRAAGAPAMAMSDMDRAGDDEGEAPPPPPSPPDGRETPVTTVRMVHYDGWAQVRVPRVEDGIAALEAVAAAHEGTIEQISGATVVLRVPVVRFEAAWAAAKAVGEVVDERVTAEDVTEAFTAVTLRLRTARATRDRLVQLLAKATTEAEKLELVRQIQRVSEDIERLEASSRHLADLAARSRLTLELVPREALVWQGEDEGPAELAWIRRLSPFRRDVASESRVLVLPEVPDGMVRLDERRAWVVESADGTRMWSHRLRNAPEGDAAFWVEALRGRLGREFASASVTAEGGFQVLTLIDRGETPYTWLLAVRVAGRDLDLVQAWLPSPEQAARHEAAVRAALRAAGGGA